MSMLRKINNIWKENDAFIKVNNKWYSSTPWIKINGVWKTIPAKTLYKKILKDNPTKLRRTNFNAIFNENTTGKIFIADGNQTQGGKTVYYFAGNTTNNWVFFAGKYWRIIRTNENKGIRLLYAGMGGEDGFIGEACKYSDVRNHPAYVGWKYALGGSLSADRKNTINSLIYNILEEWYNSLAAVHRNFIDLESIYYNDRNIGSGSYSTSNAFDYAARTRLESNTPSPTFKCDVTSDKFGKFGLMTADEVIFAGGKWSTICPNVYYAMNANGGGSTGIFTWWTMSPYYYSGTGASLFAIGNSSNHGMLAYGWTNTNRAIRPVISLKPDVLWQSGDGTFSNPYKIIMNEKLLFEKILEDNPTKSRRTDFSVSFAENTTGKIFIADGNQTQGGKTVYYFAGNTTNNWVYFAGKYWRIIRTNENGGIRLLYAGSGGTDGYIGSGTYNNSCNHPAYVGWKYTVGGSLSGDRGNANNSNAYNIVANWFKGFSSTDKNYIDTGAIYCNDRNLASGETYNTKSSFDYAAYRRLNENSPTFNCSNSSDSFKDGFGLMTSDELMFAGGKYLGGTNNNNVYFYLNANGGSSTGNNNWWTISPCWYTGSSNNGWASLLIVRADAPGKMYYANANQSEVFRPVISLKPSVLWKSGDGTFANPYKIVQN